MNRGDTRFCGIRAVTFDAAGTLLHPHPSVGAVYREVALAHGCDLPAEQLTATFRTAFAGLSKDPLVLDPAAREKDFWRRVVTTAFVRCGGSPRNGMEALFLDLWETFAHATRWRLFPGVKETLTALRGRGFRLAVLSNWDERLHSVLAETGLRSLFDAVLISSEVGVEKPDAGIFRAAEHALECTPAACLHIGDSRHHDLAGARAAGWSGVIVRHDLEACGPDEIGNLSSLPDLLPGQAGSEASAAG